MKIVPVGTEVVLRTVERDVPDPTTGVIPRFRKSHVKPSS